MRNAVLLQLLAAAVGLSQIPLQLPTSKPPAAAPRTAPPAATVKPVRSAPPAATHPGGVLVRDLKFPALNPIRMPEVQRFTLANGMKLLLLEDHELPIVKGTAMIRTGNLFDPPDKLGLATMTGILIRSGGAHGQTGDELNVKLEDLAAEIDSSIGESSGSISFSALKPHTEPVLQAFKDVLTDPEFRADKIDLAKAQVRNGIARGNDVPQAALRREFADNVYGKKTPYGWREDYTTINRIRRTDLQAFYRRYFFPANVILAVQGDFDTGQMKTQLERLFADWTVQQPAAPSFPKVEPAPPGMYTAIKTELAKTFFGVGLIGSDWRDKDTPALQIMASVLGGGIQSRFAKRLQGRVPPAFDAQAAWFPSYDHPGLFEIMGSTDPLTTESTLKTIRTEVERLRTAEISDEELKLARETALNNLALAYDTKAKTLARLLEYEYFGYPADFVQQYAKALAAVTKADVLRAASQHLDSAKLSMVLVGNPGALGPTLEAGLGRKAIPIEMAIQPPKPEAVGADAESIAKGKQMLARAQAALGGAGKLAAVKDYVLKRSFELLLGPTQGSKENQTERWLPGRLRIDNEGDLGDFSLYCDRQYGWVGNRRGSGPLPQPQFRSMRVELLRSYFQLMVSDRIEGRSVSALDDDTIEIGDSTGVVRIVFDRKTGLPSRLLYDEENPQGMPVAMQEILSDYREVAGILVPHAWKTMQGVRPYLSVTVSAVELNKGLKPEELEKRP